MKNRTLVVLLLAIACGAVAGYSALQLLSRQPAQVVPDQPAGKLQIVVARQRMDQGHVLGEEDVKLVDWPGDAVPDGAPRMIPDVIGRALKQEVFANEPLLDAKLAERGSGGGLQILIPEGQRGFTIRVDEQTGVAGFINPGNRVDIMVTMDPPGGGTDPVTRTTLQNMLVLSRGQQPIPDENGTPVVVPVLTLAVTPEEAERLGAAVASGTRMQLALRNPIDVKEIRTNGFRRSNLLSVPGGSRLPSVRSSRGTAAPPTTVESPRTIETLRGGKKALLRFRGQDTLGSGR